ncbi:MAG: DUF6776 family protein [Gammaproteobacteria bacterium]
MDVKRTEFLIFRTWKLRLLFGLVAAIVLLGGWGAYRLGIGQCGGLASDLRAVSAERDVMNERLHELETRNLELERQLVLLERSRQIDAQACAVFTQERSGLQNEIQGLRDELGFYRGIMSPQQGKTGLDAQDFTVDAALGTGRYRYRIVLTQLGRNEQVARGRVELALEGLQGPEPRRLAASELSPDGDSGSEYRFRYFQVIEGYVQLPEGFVPERVLLKAVPATAPRLPLEWTFDWPLDKSGEPAEG